MATRGHGSLDLEHFLVETGTGFSALDPQKGHQLFAEGPTANRGWEHLECLLSFQVYRKLSIQRLGHAKVGKGLSGVRLKVDLVSELFLA